VHLDIADARIRRLVNHAVRHMPVMALNIPSLERIVLLPDSPTPTLAALTHYVKHEEVISTRGNQGRRREVETQTINLYANLLVRLSDDAVMAILVHELAHAWLNEHVKPEDSPEREEASDELARRWGFGAQIAALERETLPV
jgi:Zn-dependent protease with chaperone function